MSGSQPPGPPPPGSQPPGSQPQETPPGDGSIDPRPPFGSALHPGERAGLLADHFGAHAGTHTSEALGRAAMAAGYSHEEVLAAIAEVERRFAAVEGSAPRRSLAQRAILAALVDVSIGVVAEAVAAHGQDHAQLGVRTQGEHQGPPIG